MQVAMGLGGTEVAKDAADMVLTDDDFSTVEAAVEEGRGVFDNLTMFIVWTLPTNMAEGLVILVAILLGVALPILPTQILWINMTTAVALGLMLAFEPKEPGIMQRPPRDPQRPLLTAALVRRILLVSALLLGAVWWLFQWALAVGAGLAEARTAAVNLFVAVELAYLFSCRSLVGPAWRMGLFSNRWIIVGVTDADAPHGTPSPKPPPVDAQVTPGSGESDSADAGRTSACGNVDGTDYDGRVGASVRLITRRSQVHILRQ